MRKHDVRKWLHAILDLLPVILIPVFMIYSHRHTIDSGSIDVPQNQVVDFNQILAPTYLKSDSYLGITTSVVDNHIHVEGTLDTIVTSQNLGLTNVLNNDDEHLYYFKGSSPVSIERRYGTTYYTDLPTIAQFESVYFYLTFRPVDSGTYFNYDLYLEVFDLTQMFGSGNEPTIEQFNQWYSETYYEYVVSRKELLQVGSLTYSDTDIMSQMTYQLYNSVDKYFNMGNVFHLGEVYDWFNLNIFNGNAPISVYIVYQIVLYELVMDLLFLLYALFMWFIDMIQKLMEKPLNSIK